MPWTETSAVEQRMAFVREALREVDSKAALCRRYGISRPTGDKWIRRYLAEGSQGLEDRSSAPLHHPNEVSAAVAERIVALRTRRMTWGPRKLKAYLHRREPWIAWPAASTIGELLGRRGLSGGRKRRRRTPPYTEPFVGCDSPNAVWCADFKGWFRTGDGRRCDPLTLTDAYSRYLLRCQAMADTGGEETRRVFESAFRQYGLPLAIRTDNGPPFASTALGGLSRLAVWWIKLGIVPERIEPGQPQQNGRHERMHLTLKQETAQPPRQSLRAQQRCFRRWLQEYNRERPHEALGQQPPQAYYARSVRSYPRRLASPSYSGSMEVRSVRHNGQIKWRGGRVYMSEVLAHEQVGLQRLTEGYWMVYFYAMLLGVFEERRKRVWSVAQSISKGWLDADVLPRPFRCASGAGQNDDP